MCEGGGTTILLLVTPIWAPLILGVLCSGVSVVFFMVWPKPKSPQQGAARSIGAHIVLRWFHSLVWVIFALACFFWAGAMQHVAARLSVLSLLIYCVFLITLKADRKTERKS